MVPGYLLAGQSRQLGDSHAGIEARPGNQALLVGGTGCGEAVGFVEGKRFACVLEGHGGW